VRREKGKRVESCPAGDRPARQRWQKEAVSKMKGILLNRIQVRDSERVDDEGEEGAATFDGKSLKQKRKYWNGERKVESKKEMEEGTKMLIEPIYSKILS
jgi:hypothetical protein